MKPPLAQRLSSPLPPLLVTTTVHPATSPPRRAAGTGSGKAAPLDVPVMPAPSGALPFHLDPRAGFLPETSAKPDNVVAWTSED